MRNLLGGDTGEKGIAIVETTKISKNVGANELSCCLIREEMSDDAYFTDLEIGCATDIAHLFLHGQTRVEKDSR